LVVADGGSARGLGRPVDDARRAGRISLAQPRAGPQAAAIHHRSRPGAARPGRVRIDRQPGRARAPPEWDRPARCRRRPGRLQARGGGLDGSSTPATEGAMLVRSLSGLSWRRLGLGFDGGDGARAFVRVIWVIMFAAALAFVGRYGSSLPHHDEYGHMVPLLTGQHDLSLRTLWQQHNEYRWPLPKLLLYLLLKLTGADFRSGMFACVIALGGLSGAMILAARRLRGRTSYADALFPILFLHWGHYENMLMGCQICYVLPLCFACIILLIILHDRDGMTLKSSMLAGGCLVGLPLCGGSGVGLTPALAIWLGGVGVWGW